MAANDITLADGQVASSATSILTTSLPLAGVAVSLANTSASTTETVVLTLARNAGTQRRIARVQLAPNETAEITGIALNGTDVLYATTTNASTVDYVARLSNAPAGIRQHDSTGAVKDNGWPSGAASIGARLTARLLATGPAPTDTYGAAMTIDVTSSFHVVAGVNGTSATVTMTPSAAGTAGDHLFILTTADNSGTVTATFASTFKSTGTQATTANKFSVIEFVSNGTNWLEVCRQTALT